MRKYIDWKNFKEFAEWKNKQNFYGNAFILKRSLVLATFIFMCIVTPFTNWMIPFWPKLIKKDIIIRYN
ncbi:MAG: hypothetical protein ACQER9_04505 [Nanobdellota archaeon]